ncbi:MAG: hypothetical protein R2877_02650 [Bdellovibrionota bacterium]
MKSSNLLSRSTHSMRNCRACGFSSGSVGKINIKYRAGGNPRRDFRPIGHDQQSCSFGMRPALAKMRGVAAFRSVKQGSTEPNLFTFLQSNCGGGTPENVKSFIDSEVLGILDVRSDVFRIEASGFAGDIEKKIEAVVLRSGDKPKVLYWKVY